MADTTKKYGVYSYKQEKIGGSCKYLTPSGETVICTEVYINPECKSNFIDAVKLGEVSDFLGTVVESSVGRTW